MMNKAVTLGIVLSLAGITACGSSNSDFYDDLRYVATKDLAINKSATRIPIGKTEQLVPVFTPDSATERGVNWQTDDNTIVTVDSTGTITGMALGSSRITMTTADGSKTAYCDVTVIPETTTTTFSTGTTFTLVTTPTVKEVTTGVKPKFPTGASDSTFVNVPDPFMMSETDVTYQLWKEVYDWATIKGYVFANSGKNGNNVSMPLTSTQYPVTSVSWRDAMVWCNALTEYCNAHNESNQKLAVVYLDGSSPPVPIRESNLHLISTVLGTQDNPNVNPSAKGFRLPTSIEYEFAARYIGITEPLNENNWVCKDGVYYTNGNSASGATADKNDLVITSLYEVFYRNYTTETIFTPVTETATVKSKRPNALGLYDMSGNVRKWIDGWKTSSSRLYSKSGYDDTNIPTISTMDGGDPYMVTGSTGFRFVRSK